MQRIIFPIILVLFPCFLSAQEVPQQQKTLITKVTATWCRTCGEVAWDNFRRIIENNSENAVFLAAHISNTSKLHTPIAAEFAQNLPDLFGQPTFYINKEKQENNDLVETINTFVQTTAQTQPIANTGIKAVLNANEIIAHTNTHFFQTTKGDFYLSLFLVENEVIADQASRGSNVRHEKILRASFFDNVMGTIISEGTINKGGEKKITISKNLNENWRPENLEIISILWQKEGDKFNFVNTNSSPLAMTTATTDLQKPVIHLEVKPTILPANSPIKLTIDRPLQKAIITVYNLNGQQLQTIFSGYLANGLHEFSLADLSQPASSAYFLVLESDGYFWTQKIIVL